MACEGQADSSGNDFAVGDRAVLFFRFDARVVDALHAVSALFHNAAAANSDLRIALELERRRFPILEAQEVEAAHFVGAVVGAIPRADAAVVDHVVEAFGAVYGGTDGANLLAGRVFALLAGDGLEEGFGIRERIVILAAGIAGFGLDFVVAVDANPVHFAPAHHLVLANDGNIVFRLAGDHARVATVAVV